jgi:hypothetical protein
MKFAINDHERARFYTLQYRTPQAPIFDPLSHHKPGETGTSGPFPETPTPSPETDHGLAKILPRTG